MKSVILYLVMEQTFATVILFWFVSSFLFLFLVDDLLSADWFVLGFRDHSLYKGHQVFLYKRAQIFTADLWGAFKGKGYGNFYDISSITIFADYIIPAVLRNLGVLKYSSALSNTIDSKKEIGSGSEEEVEIRACTIHAVEKMRELIETKFGKKVIPYLALITMFLLSGWSTLTLRSIAIVHKSRLFYFIE